MYFESIICAIIFAVSMLSAMPLSALTDSAKNSGNSALEAASAASLAWLGIVDKGNYAESWDKASDLLKLTIRKDEWVTLMNKIRKPLGNVVSRQVLDLRTSKNPHALPKGDYMVLFYKTAFTQKPATYEMVTLYLEDSEWLVVTYQVTSATERQ